MEKRWYKLSFPWYNMTTTYTPFDFPWINRLFNTSEQKVLNHLDHLTQASILLSIHVIKADGKLMASEKKYLMNHLITFFPSINATHLEQLIDRYIVKITALYDPFRNQNVDYSKSLDDAIDDLNQFVKDKEVKNHVAYLLFGIAHADKSFHVTEKNLLIEICHKLGLTRMDIARLFAFFANKISTLEFNKKHHWEIPKVQSEKKTKKSEKKQNTSTSQKKKTSINVSLSLAYRLSNALAILGVPNNAPAEQIKRAYKKLAMLNHPDRFINASELQRKIATEKFVKIQEAYELVKKIKGFN